MSLLSFRQRFNRLGPLGLMLVMFSLYVGSYSVLSATGRYLGRPSGEIRYANNFAVTDLSLWCPRIVIWERRKSISGEYIIDANLAGWFYFPLIQLDRMLFHPTGHYFYNSQ